MSFWRELRSDLRECQAAPKHKWIQITIQSPAGRVIKHPQENFNELAQCKHCQDMAIRQKVAPFTGGVPGGMDRIIGYAESPATFDPVTLELTTQQQRQTHVLNSHAPMYLDPLPILQYWYNQKSLTQAVLRK